MQIDKQVETSYNINNPSVEAWDKQVYIDKSHSNMNIYYTKTWFSNSPLL